MEIQIGGLRLRSNLILAPMAGVTDFPFRMLNRKFGCELAFTEMINCRSVSFKSKKTQQMLYSSDEDKPLGVQLLGSEAEYLNKAIAVLKAYKFDLLDFNAACPAKKVIRRNEGAGLLREPKKIKELLKLIVKGSGVPVTVKIRIGWDKDSINASEVAKAAQDSGISAIFIHGRTRTHGYSGEVNYAAIRSVKKILKIPVIASGDIFSPVLAKKMFDETGCDGLIIARGALGNPWIFRQIKEFLDNTKLIPRPDTSEIIRTMTEHLNMCVDFYGEKNGVIIYRKFFSWYTRGFRRIRPLREASNRVKTKEDMIANIRRIELRGSYAN